jgi:hypothetical protein
MGDDIERSKKRQMGTMETMQRNRKGLKYIKNEEEWRSVDESMEGWKRIEKIEKKRRIKKDQ